MKFITVVVFILAASFFVGPLHACEALPDIRSWEEVTANFIATEGKYANDGEADGRRLKELDPKRTVTFLIPFLAKERTKGLRLKAIGALGWSSFVEVIPALSAIAMDATENEEIRTAALNPGLRYMKNPEAVKIASALATDKSDNIRRGAYWVLSSHGTDNAIKVLTERLRVNDKPLLRDLIYALMFSNHPRAGKIIYEHVDFTTLPHDEEYLCAYSSAMNQYRIPEAQPNMLSIAQQSTHSLSVYYALQYFSAFPRQDVVPALVAYIKNDKYAVDLIETVTEFVKSSKISDESKKKLSELITSGKVRKIVVLP